MKRENMRALREGAMMVALTVILMILNKYVPMFSVVGVFMCGVPMAALAARNGFKIIISAVVSSFLVAILIDGGIISAVSTILMSVLPGAVAGYMLGRKKAFFYTLFATSLMVCLGWIFELLMIELVVGQGIDKMFAEAIAQMRTAMNGVIQSLGQTIKETAGISSDEFAEKLFQEVEFTIRTFFPSIVVVSSMFSAYIIIRLSGFIIKRAKLASIEVLPFSMLKAPRSISVVAVIAFLFYLFSDAKGVFASVLTNVVFVLYMVLGVCGLSFIDFKIKNTIKSAPLRILIYVLVMFFGGMLIGFVLNLLIIIGILDSGRDFRKIGDCGQTGV